jgi:hypothetical protein
MGVGGDIGENQLLSFSNIYMGVGSGRGDIGENQWGVGRGRGDIGENQWGWGVILDKTNKFSPISI